MRLTRKKAIELSKELWIWASETGLHKYKWPKWKSKGGEYDDADCHCFLCEYEERKERRTPDGGRQSWQQSCAFCPYSLVYGHCNVEGKPFYKWDHARKQPAMKKHAKEFLEQLKTL